MKVYGYDAGDKIDKGAFATIYRDMTSINQKNTWVRDQHNQTTLHIKNQSPRI